MSGRGLPWIGEGLAFARDPFAFLNVLRERDSSLATFRAAGMKIHSIHDPQLIEQILVWDAASYDKGPILNRLSEVFGNGLLTAEGENWKKNRRRLNPAFHREAIPAYRELIETASTRAWAQIQPGQTLELTSFCRGLMLRVALGAFFGEREIDPADEPEIAADFERINRYFEFLLSGPGQVLGRIPSPGRLLYLRSVHRLDHRIYASLDRRWNVGQDAKDPQAVLIRSARQEGASSSELRDDLMTLFLAGHETSAMALAFCLDILTQNNNWSDRLRSSPALLGPWIREVLRLYPPVWSIVRRATRATQLGSTAIHAGELVLIPIWSIHRDIRHFSDPLEFRPERWSKDSPEASLRPRAAYIPFGFGPRMCIGSEFALMELEIITRQWLTNMVHNNRWKRLDSAALEPGHIPVTGSLTLRPKHPAKLMFQGIQ